jgi:hypothetical protein
MPASVSTVGTLALKIAEGFNILQPGAAEASLAGNSRSKAAADAAGQLCAVLESLCRTP